jgi:septum formation topological specificity factor MinE
MPNGLMQLIKSDLVKILSAYFEFDKSNLDIVIGNDKDGLCDIKITAKAERIKPPRFL